MTDTPTPAPPPEPAEPSGRATDGAAVEPNAPRQPFVMRFPRAHVLDTDFAVRSPSVGQHSETVTDSRNEELDDRVFAVRLVKRQLDIDVPVAEVEAWPDEQLLAAALGYLSLVAREPKATGAQDEVDEDGADGEAHTPKPDTSTFAGIRTAIREDDERRNAKMRALFERMDPLKGLDLGNLTGDAFRNLGVVKGLDTFTGFDLAELSGTNRIAESIAKLAADTGAMERFAAPKIRMPELTMPIMGEPTYIGPIVKPEVRLLEEVSETLEKMHDDELRTNEGQIAVLVEVAALLKTQGLALEALATDTKGQKWPRHIMLGATLIAAATAVVAALFAAGFWRPIGDPAVAPPSPSTMLSPSVAPTATPTAALTPTPAPTVRPSPTWAVSASPAGSVEP